MNVSTQATIIERTPWDIEAEQLRLERIAESINSIKPVAKMLKRLYEA